jgi:hypothetical protein
MNAAEFRLDRFDRPVVALIILVLCAALAIVTRPLNAFFNEPLLDDGYYVLTIARRIGLGQGVTYDGTTLTNGFQPLWVFLCALLFWLSDGERLSGVRCVLVVHWLLYALGALLTAALAKRVFAKSTDRPRSAALIAALVFLSSSFIWENGFNGLETSLSIACLLAAMLCYVSIDRRNRLHLAGCGVLLGLVVLARIDAVFFVILLTAIQLARRGVGWKERIVDALCLAGPAFLVSSPWWAFNVIAFGHLTPSSGLALQDWAPTRSRYMTSVGALIRALTPMVDFLNSDTWLRAIARAPLLGLAIYWTWPELGALFRGLDRPLAEILLALALFVVVLAIWYPSSSWASFFYSRYFAPASIIGVLFWTFVVLKFVRRVDRNLVVAGLALIAAQVPVLVVLHSDASYGKPAMLGEQVPLVDDRVPPNDLVGAVQSGTLGFMRDHVVNLDGRVNFEALGRRHDMAQYLRERDIRWFADWPFLAQEYLGPDPAKSGWSPVATKGSMTLYRYDGRQ